MSTVHQESTELQWGRDYLMVEPNHFRVDYAINPFMNLNDQPEPLHTRAEWLAVVAAIEAAGGRVQVLPQLPDAPDMVYAMNLGLALESANDAGDPDAHGDRRVVLSHMRFPQRRMETPAAEDWFAANGFTSKAIGRYGVGAHFEAGDAFAWRGELVVGYGPRSEELALKHLATDLGVSVRGFRITHPGMYHMDLGFCPLDDTHAMVCPAAYDDASAAALLALVTEPTEFVDHQNLIAHIAYVGQRTLAHGLELTYEVRGQELGDPLDEFTLPPRRGTIHHHTHWLTDVPCRRYECEQFGVGLLAHQSVSFHGLVVA